MRYCLIMKYTYLRNHRRHRRYIKQTRLLTSLLCLVLIAIAYVLVDARWQDVAQPEPVSKQSQVIRLRGDRLMSSPYFQFQAPKDWVEVPNETTATTYVYRRYNVHLIEKELRLYTEPAKDVIKTARVLPVTIKDQQLVATSVSELCRQAPYFSARPLMPHIVQWQNVSFLCDSESNAYTVTVGQVGGNNDLPIRRPNGDAGHYQIIYRDLSAEQKPDDLLAIIDSFRAR